MPAQPHIATVPRQPGTWPPSEPPNWGACVSVVESKALGGVCLNWGWIPSKALLAVGEVGNKVKKAAAMGLHVNGPVTYDLSQMEWMESAEAAEDKAIHLVQKKAG